MVNEYVWTMTEGEVGGGAALGEDQHVGLSLASAGANANGIVGLRVGLRFTFCRSWP